MAAADKALALGPSVVLVTSLAREDGPDDRIEMLAVRNSEAYLVDTPKLPLSVNGAGDATARLVFRPLFDDR